MNLVTGATGIVGSHVALALLQQGREVVATHQAGSDLNKTKTLFSFYSSEALDLFNRIKWIEVDIRDVYGIEAALQGIDYVYHCAGFVSFDKKDRQKLFDINEKGTRNIVDACLHKSVKALCHVSSVATINNLDYTSDLTEEVFWKTSGRESDYALSKYNAEREVWRGIEEGLNATIVNPGVVLSPGFWNQSSSQFFDICYKGNKFYTNGMAAYIAATDVARTMIFLIDAENFGERYILVENSYTYHNILSTIQSKFGKPEPAINASAQLLKFAGFFEKMASFFSNRPVKLNKAVINAALNKQIFSNRKIKKLIDFDFRPTHTVIEQICDQYLRDRQKANK
ncbi:MAG: NAD-dependent epimerase/dehydratase family protein [Bacteroidia bacterium]|nr:NAD-dependent epimerase/dehydratase family protein [Bacteroidia bacterium]